jgi:hypothetical protein
MLGHALECFVAKVEQEMPFRTGLRSNGSPIFGRIQQGSITFD